METILLAQVTNNVFANQYIVNSPFFFLLVIYCQNVKYKILKIEKSDFGGQNEKKKKKIHQIHICGLCIIQKDD